jgi:hypothetical protein
MNTQAELVLMSATINAKNDCNHYFDDPNQKGRGFEQCNIFSYNEHGDYIKISPVIAKFETGASFQASNLYQSEVEQSDWVFNNGSADIWNDDLSNSNFGRWRYDDGNGIDSQPGIRFWSAKAGKQFTLFWKVEQHDVDNACTPPSSLLSLNCLNAAKPVLEGTYTTPQSKNLSHLVFYNSRDASICETDWCFTKPEVNEPPTAISISMASITALSLILWTPYGRRKRHLQL